MNRLKKLYYGMAAVLFLVGSGTAFAQVQAVLDIDGNGVVDGTTDAILVERYLYEFSWGEARTPTYFSINNLYRGSLRSPQPT